MAELNEILEEAIFNNVLRGHCLDPFNCILRGEFTQLLLVLRGTGQLFLNRGMSSVQYSAMLATRLSIQPILLGS